MDRDQLAHFLRSRRESLAPEDVGIPRGPRRRTAGLRREEVAALAQMSTDYYSRLEQSRGPQPSESMLAAIARALRLSLDERDHMFRLAGQSTPSRTVRYDHISPGLMRVLDRLQDTPAQVMNVLGETLVQTPSAVALLGDQVHLDGLSRNVAYRFFTDAAVRARYPREDHEALGRTFASDLREASVKLDGDPRLAAVIDALLAESSAFERVWNTHEVGRHFDEKRFIHPELGAIDVHCQHLHDPSQMQNLLVFTATPGSESADKLALLDVMGRQMSA